MAYDIPTRFHKVLSRHLREIKRTKMCGRIIIRTRKNCFRYLKLMSPLNAAICTTTYLERQKCYGLDKKILFKKQLFDLEVKGQGPTKVITVPDTPPYGHAPTHMYLWTEPYVAPPLFFLRGCPPPFFLTIR